ncbi:AAA family ATPase [Pyruvatibacter sp.]|uniref:AAA family ATPase n=1 Tax=Pyruvatibacter sp. TaxID=1981328 RepID=UPI0032ECD39E
MCGLPGTGKTTASRPLAGRLGALYLRVDSIEQAIASSAMAPVDAVEEILRTIS